jgi:hypothetical protein
MAVSRFDRSFARAQAAYDAMEAPEEHAPLTDEEREHEHAMAYDRQAARAEYRQRWYAAFGDEDDISF